MLIIDVKDSETIDRALKRLKRKVQATGLISELRSRKHYRKPSVNKRNTLLKAQYRQKKRNEMLGN